ncbi:phytoene/squalene synthase family protein [Streptomyces sp. NRRL F-5123]|uniref:phytoene/squalene synthase family protein n=1 Tax=Streptomyces sp. NRRL F-5123 TaxID=1463856 RepID=UPI0004E2453D|nr:squalene/phytoene synthase family protein [Streptomyces sp. NRRL F-5123]
MSARELDAAGIHDPLLRDAYGHCEARLLHHNHAAHAGSRALMAPAKRPYWDAIMAFCGHADDLADARDSSPEQRRHDFDAFVADFDRTLAADPAPAPAAQPASLVCTAFADFVRTWQIPGHSLRQAQRAVREDMAVREYRTTAELDRYIAGVSGQPALWLADLFGTADTADRTAARDAAVSLGVSLQILDNLTDVPEDLHLGKLYLPLDDLSRCGLTRADVEEAVAGRHSTAPLRRLVALHTQRARDHLSQGEAWPGLAHPASRDFVQAMVSQTRQATELLESADYDLFVLSATAA